jgi:trimethylamine--corrinoid protein Co-methyltransferase
MLLLSGGAPDPEGRWLRRAKLRFLKQYRILALRSNENGAIDLAKSQARGYSARAGCRRCCSRHRANDERALGESTMRARTTWLDDGEKSRIVDEAMGVLAGVGMRFAGSTHLPELAARGAQVDDRRGIVRLPRELTEWALAQCPRRVLLAGARPEDDVVLDDGEPLHFAPSGCVAKTLDHRTGERRASTLQDLRDTTGLNEELPNLDVMWLQVAATDVPLEQRELVEYFTLLTETRKHVTFVDPPSDTEAVGRICETVGGDLDAFRRRPRLSTVLTAASPLQCDGPALDRHIELARFGVPVNVYSMAIAGATSPVTLAGSVVEGVAEFLGAATALQVAAPGARLVFCFGTGVLDMRQTTFSIGSLESAQMGAMAAEVGHFMGVPTLHPGLSTDAKHPGLQAGYEKALKLAAVCSARPDIVTGWGLLDSHNSMFLPQSVVDNEIAGMIRRLHGEVEVSDATLAAGSIAGVGPGGGFLGERETARRIRAGEHFLPSISDRLSFEKWAEEGATELDTARAEVERLLATHLQQPCLERDAIEELAAVCGVDEALRRYALRDGWEDA